MWMDTKYEPGTLKVVAYDKEGNAVAEEEVHTAGKPHHIELSADRNQLTADGKDLSFINVRVVDKNGNLCPDDTRQIQFKVLVPEPTVRRQMEIAPVWNSSIFRK